MIDSKNLIHRDIHHVWHPATQMKDFETYPPFVVEKARGSYLYTNKGQIIDAISSWWCKSLGHGHPAIIAAITEQLQRFEHVVTANTTHPVIVELSELLAEITGKQHVFFASDGSSAVEIAMKLALQAQQIQGNSHKNEFMALKNAYHGETLGTLSVSDIGIYKKPFEQINLTCHFIDDIPYVSGIDDPLWTCCAVLWPDIEEKLNKISENICALIVEPLVQGAAGMLCYSADFLKRLVAWAKARDIYVIADEIMTGVGRTGKWLASQHANIEPDLICLSKGLTSGSLPLSCVMIDNAIYELFYADVKEGKSFLHSHTYSGNPLAVSAALATIKTIYKEGIIQQVDNLHNDLMDNFFQVAQNTGLLTNIRSVGGLVAGDIVSDISRIGFKVYQEALERGALIRPIGKALYWLPPLNTESATIERLGEITQDALLALHQGNRI